MKCETDRTLFTRRFAPSSILALITPTSVCDLQTLSDLHHLKSRGQRLLELGRLIGVLHAERVQVLGAAHLELGHARRLLDLHRSRILPARRVQEVLNFANFFRLFSHRAKSSLDRQSSLFHHPLARP